MDMMLDTLERLIAMRTAELDALASHLKWSRQSMRTLAGGHPHIWAEHLAQLAQLSEYARALPLHFTALVADAASNMRRG